MPNDPATGCDLFWAAPMISSTAAGEFAFSPAEVAEASADASRYGGRQKQ